MLTPTLLSKLQDVVQITLKLEFLRKDALFYGSH